MEIVEAMESGDYEQLVVAVDKNAGLKALIAIHDTTLGPASGRHPHLAPPYRSSGTHRCPTPRSSGDVQKCRCRLEPWGREGAHLGRPSHRQA